MIDYSPDIEAYIAEEKRVLDALDADAISAAMNALVDAGRKGKTIYVMGNGGSSATASHFICDFAKGVYMETGIPFRMICLSDNTPIASAISNDIGYEDVFKFQLQDRVEDGDLILAISGSGNSENVLRAARHGKSQGAKVIGLTGYNGGELKKLSDISLHVPVDNMQITEDLHMMLDHVMMWVLSKKEQ